MLLKLFNIDKFAGDGYIKHDSIVTGFMLTYFS
jgi:hypothetical protein